MSCILMLFNSNSFNIPDICEYFVHELRSVTNLGLLAAIFI